MSRKFLYHQGKFFVLFGDYRKKGITFGLGPERYISLPLFIGVSILYIYIMTYFQEVCSIPFFVKFLRVISTCAIVTLAYTATINPGVIYPDEDNSIENMDKLEAANYSYCTQCEMYRPAGAKHCSVCGVCIEKLDHHCSMMGQCVGKNNTISFYFLVISAGFSLTLINIVSIYGMQYFKIIKGMINMIKGFFA